MSFSTPVLRPDLLNPYPFSDLAFKAEIKLLLLRLEREQINSSNSFQICIFLFLSYLLGIETINTFIHFRSSLENHTRFQTQMGKVYMVFRPKQRENPTRWGGPHLYSLYEEVPPWALISTRQNIFQ